MNGPLRPGGGEDVQLVINLELGPRNSYSYGGPQSSAGGLTCYFMRSMVLAFTSYGFSAAPPRSRKRSSPAA